MQPRTIKRKLLKSFAMHSQKGKVTKSYLKEKVQKGKYNPFNYSSRSRFCGFVHICSHLFTFVTIVTQILIGQSLVDSNCPRNRRSIRITHTIAKQIQIGQRLVDFDYLSNRCSTRITNTIISQTQIGQRLVHFMRMQWSPFQCQMCGLREE